MRNSFSARKGRFPQRLVERKDDDSDHNEELMLMQEEREPEGLPAALHEPISIEICPDDGAMHVFKKLATVQGEVNGPLIVAWQDSSDDLLIILSISHHAQEASSSVSTSAPSPLPLATLRASSAALGNSLLSLLSSGHLGLTLQQGSILCLGIIPSRFDQGASSSHSNFQDPAHDHGTRLLCVLKWLLFNSPSESGEDEDDDDGDIISVDDLFSLVRPPSKPSGYSFTQPTRLLPALRPYQMAAVEWMLRKERQGEAESSIPHPQWIEVKPLDASRPSIFVNDLNGLLSDRGRLLDVRMGRGGILADQMGLGKTCEVLALILSSFEDEMVSMDPNGTDHKSTGKECVDLCQDDDLEEDDEDEDDGDWASSGAGKRKKRSLSMPRRKKAKSPLECSSCNSPLSKDDPSTKRRRFKDLQRSLPSLSTRIFCGSCLRKYSEDAVWSSNNGRRSTLIVCPASILPQWQAEIERHAPSLSLLVYPGQDLKGGMYHQVSLSDSSIQSRRSEGMFS